MNDAVKDPAPESGRPPGKDRFAEVLEAVTESSRGPQPPGAPGILSAAVRDALGRGGDLVPSAKGILMGLLRGTGAREAEALRLIEAAARAVIRHAAGLGSDVGGATKGLVLGAIAGSKAAGLESATAATTTAQGALVGAGEAGSAVVERVIRALEEPIGGRPVVFVKPPVR